MLMSNRVLNGKLQLVIVIAATLGAIIPSIYSLSHGIYEAFPFLYILPIILVVYFYPRCGVIYSLGMSLVYIGLVYLFGNANPGLIAVSTAWFAIFIAIGVVASSYANRLRDEAEKIRSVFNNSQDGIFCFDRRTKRISEINPMCARMLRYKREELLGKDISAIWPEGAGMEEFLSFIGQHGSSCQREILLRTKDGAPWRCLISAVLSTSHLVLCSASDISNQRIAEEEIRQTMEDLERQVKERTAHLEKINQELKAEILERRKFESTILSGDQKNGQKRGWA